MSRKNQFLIFLYRSENKKKFEIDFLNHQVLTNSKLANSIHRYNALFVCLFFFVTFFFQTHSCNTDEKDMDRVFKLPSTTFIGGQDKALPLRLAKQYIVHTNL